MENEIVDICWKNNSDEVFHILKNCVELVQESKSLSGLDQRVFGSGSREESRLGLRLREAGVDFKKTLRKKTT